LVSLLSAELTLGVPDAVLVELLSVWRFSLLIALRSGSTSSSMRSTAPDRARPSACDRVARSSARAGSHALDVALLDRGLIRP
jgi:hypothetical protein